MNDKVYQECRKAAEVVGLMKAGWNLANTLECAGQKTVNAVSTADFETAWGNPVTTPEMIKAVRDAGFGAVRVPVTWGPHMDENYRIDKVWLDRVTEVVGYVLDAGMFCIINVHHDTGERGWLRAMGEPGDEMHRRFAAIWQQLCEHFADYDDRLIFEGYNEMLDEEAHWKFTDAASLARLNALAQLFVDTVRSRGGYNPTRNLLVMPYAGAHSNERLGGFAMPKDSTEGHLILEVHNYDPTGFCWHNSEEPARDFWGNESDMELLYSSMRDIAHHAKRFGVPAVIGEFGVEYKENDSERAKYAWHFAKSAGDLGIKCFWWDCGHFSLIDRESCRISHPDVTDALTRYDS